MFDITWEGHKPVLTLNYAYNHGITAAIRQMNFDYAGNLVVTGDNVVRVYTMPRANNTTITPAKRALVVSKGEVVATEPALPAEPVFTPAGCEYRNSIEVAIACETANTALYYTITEGENVSAEKLLDEPSISDLLPKNTEKAVDRKEEPPKEVPTAEKPNTAPVIKTSSEETRPVDPFSADKKSEVFYEHL